MEELTFTNNGRLFIAYFKGNDKYDIYSGGRLVGMAVDLFLIKMMYDYCQGHATPFILGQRQKDEQIALDWWNKLSESTKIKYSNELFGEPEFDEVGAMNDLTTVDIVKIWLLKS